MIATQLNLSVVDTPFDPDSEEKVVLYRIVEGKWLYKVWLYLEGADLVFVGQVKYILHPTFKRREQVVHRTYDNPNCRLLIYTWGIFEVRAIVRAGGESYELRRRLQYDQRFSEASYSEPE
jgi:transcription initiation factor IIF auxiliary subunit